MKTMNIILLLLLATLPVLAILWFVYSRDKKKEPMSLLIKLFISGFISFLLVIFLSRAFSFLPFMNGSYHSFISIVLYSFLGVALIEEFSKWIMTYLVGYNQQNLDEKYDMMVYAIFVALGFAFIENIFYVIRATSITTILVRAILAVPSHACDAVFMGYYLIMAKQASRKKKKSKGKEKEYLLLSIIIPTILHGIYDFCLMSGYKVLLIVFILFVTALFIISVKKINEMSKSSKKVFYKNEYCPTCGKIITDEFCANCGKKQE